MLKEMLDHQSPIQTWRDTRGLSVQELAHACGLAEADLLLVESGESGLPGELQDYLTKHGVNVSQMAVEQSAFIASLRQR